MADTISLFGVTPSIAEALRPWATELDRGTDADRLRTAVEDALRLIRASGTLTIRLDVMMDEARTASMRLADAIEMRWPPRPQRHARSARSTFALLLQEIRRGQADTPSKAPLGSVRPMDR